MCEIDEDRPQNSIHLNGMYLIICLSRSQSHSNSFFFFQAEDGIRDLVRSRGLGDVYKRQGIGDSPHPHAGIEVISYLLQGESVHKDSLGNTDTCLLYTSDAADERSSVDLGGRRIIKKKTEMMLTQIESE